MTGIISPSTRYTPTAPGDGIIIIVIITITIIVIAIEIVIIATIIDFVLFISNAIVAFRCMCVTL